MFSDTSYTNYKHMETLKGIFQCPQKLTNVIQTSQNSLWLSLRSLNKWYGVFAPQYYKFSQKCSSWLSQLEHHTLYIYQCIRWVLDGYIMTRTSTCVQKQRSFVHSGRSARVAHCARQELRFQPGVQCAWFVRCLARRNALLFSIYLEYRE